MKTIVKYIFTLAMFGVSVVMWKMTSFEYTVLLSLAYIIMNTLKEDQT